MKYAQTIREMQSVWPNHKAGQFPAGWTAKTSAVLGIAAVLATAAAPGITEQREPIAHAMTMGEAAAAAARGTASDGHVLAARPTWAVGGYGGVAYTHPSEVRIEKQGRPDITMRDFEWIARPFKSPIYYGARVQRWSPGGTVGTMIDFTHSKAIARADSPAKFTGSRNGKPLPAEGKVSDVFRHMEFSHGHNMLTFNGIFRLGTLFGRLRPYAGAGGGISLPHTEIGFAGENARTYEYQYAGLVGQALGGVEIDLGRASIFLEYKFTYAPYDVPLSHEPNGWLLVTDLWRQFSAWWKGEAPPDGHLKTQLNSHNGIGGFMIKTSR